MMVLSEVIALMTNTSNQETSFQRKFGPQLDSRECQN